MDRPLPNPAFIASLAPKNFDDAKRLARLVPSEANAIEWRLDLAPGRLSARALLELDPRCAIVTYRTVREGGGFSGTREEYRRSVESAFEAGAAADVELESGLLADPAFLPDRRRVIGSRHAPDAWDEASVSGGLETDVAALKLVRTDVRSIRAAAEGLALLRRLAPERRISCFATGKRGAFTRVLARRFGAALVYGSVEAPTAEGQIPLSDLFRTYGIGRPGAAGKIYGVYGGDVSGSLSPSIHNALFSRSGTPSLYLPFSASEGEAGGRTLRRDLEALESVELLPEGLSITNPFKSAFESIVAALDEDDAVARTGAANTIVRESGSGGETRFLARNTDAPAVLEILCGRDLTGRRIVILGAGGAARAAAYAGILAGCEVAVAARDAAKAKAVAGRFGASALGSGDLRRIEADVLINATPLGSSEEDEPPFPRALLETRPTVIDFVYRPAGTTRLVADARERGCPTADGREILARQAVGQSRLFGVPDAEFEEIDALLRSSP